jgi:sucrose-6-phosphate hydrolase SacC (GH32 family)
VRLRVLFDRSTVEVFANDGETVVSDRVYPTRPLDRIEPMRAGDTGAARLWTLPSIWP